MREIYELPNTSIKKKAATAALAAVAVWALVAIPLTLWLGMRAPDVVPPAAQRDLSVMEKAEVDSAANAFDVGYSQIISDAVTPAAKFTVTQTVRASDQATYGKITSGNQSAELYVPGNSDGSVYLRGNAAFWSVIGVPTSFAGWVNVGDKLGGIVFPLNDAVLGLIGVNPAARIAVTESTPDQMVLLATPHISAKFGTSGITEITLDGRTATVQIPTGADVEIVGGAVTGQLATAQQQLAGAAQLTGTSGALTVTVPPQPAPPETTPPES